MKRKNREVEKMLADRTPTAAERDAFYSAKLKARVASDVYGEKFAALTERAEIERAKSLENIGKLLDKK